MPQGSGTVDWTQTLADVTISTLLPPGCTARDVSCTVVDGRVLVHVRGAGVASSLLEGELWAKTIGSVWSVEAGSFTLELEKARPQYWPCAIRGMGPEVDVSELIARDRRDSEPAYRLPPDAEAKPRRVTDTETLRKLKAEFPQMDLPVDASEHAVTHRNHAGPRRQFDWGPLPSAQDAQSGVACATPAPCASKVRAEAAPDVLSQPHIAPSHAEGSAAAPANASRSDESHASSGRDNSMETSTSTNKYSWGELREATPVEAPQKSLEDVSAAVRSSSRCEPAGAAKYSWGALPTR